MTLTLLPSPCSPVRAVYSAGLEKKYHGVTIDSMRIKERLKRRKILSTSLVRKSFKSGITNKVIAATQTKIGDNICTSIRIRIFQTANSRRAFLPPVVFRIAHTMKLMIELDTVNIPVAAADAPT